MAVVLCWPMPTLLFGIPRELLVPKGVVKAVPGAVGVTALVASPGEIAVDPGTSAVPVPWLPRVAFGCPIAVPPFVATAVVPKLVEPKVPADDVPGTVPKLVLVRVAPVPVVPKREVPRESVVAAPVPLYAGVEKVPPLDCCPTQTWTVPAAMRALKKMDGAFIISILLVRMIGFLTPLLPCPRSLCSAVQQMG